MGLFDWGKKKTKNHAVEIDQNLFNAITQEIAVFMTQCQILETPALQFFHNDSGILSAVFEEHNTFDMRQMKREQPDFYMFVCGMHAFGAGVYATAMQGKLKKPVSEFTSSEVNSIMKDFKKTDAYELALSILGVNPQGKNKEILDKIIMICADVTKTVKRNQATSEKSIATYMQVLFNVGITMAMR